jgi:hypothetical protein
MFRLGPQTAAALAELARAHGDRPSDVLHDLVMHALGEAGERIAIDTPAPEAPVAIGCTS